MSNYPDNYDARRAEAIFGMGDDGTFSAHEEIERRTMLNQALAALDAAATTFDLMYRKGYKPTDTLATYYDYAEMARDVAKDVRD